jgi:hypothetical protein
MNLSMPDLLGLCLYSKRIADDDQQRRQRMVVAAAFPTALSAAVTLVVVGAAVATIFKNKEKLQSLEVAKVRPILSKSCMRLCVLRPIFRVSGMSVIFGFSGGVWRMQWLRTVSSM